MKMQSYWPDDDWNNLFLQDPEQLVDQLWQQEIDEMEWRGWDPIFPADERRMWEEYQRSIWDAMDMLYSEHDYDPYDEAHPWRAFGMSEAHWFNNLPDR